MTVLKFGAGKLYAQAADGSWVERGDVSELNICLAIDGEVVVGREGLGTIVIDTDRGTISTELLPAKPVTLSISYDAWPSERRFHAIRAPKKAGAQWKRERKGWGQR